MSIFNSRTNYIINEEVGNDMRPNRELGLWIIHYRLLIYGYIYIAAVIMWLKAHYGLTYHLVLQLYCLPFTWKAKQVYLKQYSNCDLPVFVLHRSVVQ